MLKSLKNSLLSVSCMVVMATASAAPTYQPLPSVVNPEADLVLPADETLIYNVRQYGAVGDGVTDDTRAIQAAIDACAGTGGTVLLDKGTFLSGMITLKSDMTFYINEGAVLLAKTENPANYANPDYDPIYPPLSLPTTNCTWLNNKAMLEGACPRAFLFALGAKNLKVTGKGTIDGNGTYGPWTWLGGDPDELDRPVPFHPVQCPNLTLSYVHFKDGAMWTVVPMECDNLTIHHIDINSDIVENRDGIDIVDCHNVLIEDCTIYTDDDCICPKSGHHRGVQNVTVRRCNLKHSGRANGIKFGTMSVGGFKHMYFEDIDIEDISLAGIAIESVDGAEIEDVTFKNIRMKKVHSPIFIVLAQREVNKEIGTEGFRMGSIDNLLFQDITATDITTSVGCPILGCVKDGVEYPVTNITFDNVDVLFKGGLTSVPDAPREYGKGMYPECNAFGNMPGYAFYLRHARDITFRNCDSSVTPLDVRDWLAKGPGVENVTLENNTSTKLTSLNLINADTYVADAGFNAADMPWLWDGLTNEGVTFPDDTQNVWIEFDFGREYPLAKATLWQDNGGAHVSDWQLAKWDESADGWVNITDRIYTTGAGYQSVELDASAQRVRLYASCAGNKVSIHEFSLYTPLMDVDDEDPVASFDGGDGTVANPYLISSADQLDNIRNFSDAHFLLTDDINVATWLSLARDSEVRENGWIPIDRFTGSLDGDGHFIHGIWCNRGGSDNVGLFARVEGAVISNLGVKVADEKTVVGGNNVGLIAGTGNAVISNCCAIGDIIATGKNVGGILGISPNSNSDKTIISNCYYIGEISATDGAGGLIGVSQTSCQDLISSCYCVATINRDNRNGSAGGVIGAAKIIDTSVQSTTCITIAGTFALGEQVNGASNIFGTYIRRFAGYGNPNHDRCFTFSNNYALSTMLVNGATVTNVSDNYHAQDITPESAVSASAYVDCGWNFADASTYSTDNGTWIMGNGNYPLPVLAELSLNYQPSQTPAHFSGVSAGIGEVTAGGDRHSVEYYNLQGLRVDRPTRGLPYIERRGTAVRKIIVQ